MLDWGLGAKCVLCQATPTQVSGFVDGWIVRRWSDGMEDQSSSVSVHSTYLEEIELGSLPLPSKRP
ncbi:hypothetical protein FA13DRAFT_1727417 [Coprinellus micaceus]|uniref:Uncharacterized protein n=1 Tax=Coprinellus micaceus TaxID=71717 RepID=A0A4Y7TQQ3_COPMI|nr:hypothetical protein FA13DRAFT_1727417 [Coprinellus micaceus]